MQPAAHIHATQHPVSNRVGEPSWARSGFGFGRRNLIATLLAGCLTAGGAEAQINEAPALTRGQKVEQLLGEEAALDARFFNQDGQPVELSSYFAEGRPVLLTLNYSDCPQLCILQLDGLAKAVRSLDFVPGEDFQIVTVSIDPTELPTRAKLTQEHYVGQVLDADRAASSDDPLWTGWHFLVGTEANIQAVADSVGYHFKLDPKTGDYAHEAALMVLTPDGRVSRYLFGVEYDLQTLRYSLVEASAGGLGSIVDRIAMFCYHYDPNIGAYVPFATNLMRVGAGLTAVLLGGFLLLFWRREILGQFNKSSNASTSVNPADAPSSDSPSPDADDDSPVAVGSNIPRPVEGR
jgi:protein SCO1/2